MRTVKNNVIQAFVVNGNTYVGTPTDFDVDGFELVHAAADCDVTFNFGGSNNVVVTVTNGQDLVIGPGCISVSATGTVWIS